MKRTIGGLLLVCAGLVFFLVTCLGPSPEGQAETNGTTISSSEPATPAQRTPTDDPTDPNAPLPLAAAPQHDDEQPDPLLAPPRESPSTASRRPVHPSPALAADLVPVEELTALLALPLRDLEGGTGQAPTLLLVPDDSLRQQLRIPIETDWAVLPTEYTRGHPSSTINTPTAYGPGWGDVYAGVGYQNRIRYDDWRDGVASVGVGLGNPQRSVGLDVTVNVLDTYTEFAQDRSLSLKLHRRLPYRTAVAVGHENLWHTDGTDGGSSRYVVVSKILLLRDRPTSPFGSMIVNVGLGTDRFLSEQKFAQGNDGVNAFGSVGLRVLRPVNAVANWTGQDLALGLSIAPVRTWPLVITPAVVDVTGAAGDGARFSMSAGLHYNFRR